MPLVVTRADALAAGRSAAEIDALVRRGAWRALRRAVYLTRSELPEYPAERHAALVAAGVLAVGVPSIGSHRSAAVVHGLPLLVDPGDDVVLTRVRVRRAARPDGRRAARLVAQVPPRDRAVVHGAPVTTLARTAVDLARRPSRLEAAVVLDAAVARVGLDALAAVAQRQRGWPGAARSRERLAFADPRAESPLESVARWRFHELGLPTPELQVLLGGEQAVGRVDFLFAEQRTVGEADGRLKYVTAQDLWAEKLREDTLRDAGFEVFRFTWSEALRTPRVLGERALRCFDRAAARRQVLR